MEVVRQRRLLRGQTHVEVERVLGEAQALVSLASLVLFDDPLRAHDVMARLEKEAGAPLADAFRRAHEAHDIAPADAVDLVRRTSNLVAFIRGLR